MQIPWKKKKKIVIYDYQGIRKGCSFSNDHTVKCMFYPWYFGRIVLFLDFLLMFASMFKPVLLVLVLVAILIFDN